MSFFRRGVINRAEQKKLGLGILDSHKKIKQIGKQIF